MLKSLAPLVKQANVVIMLSDAGDGKITVFVEAKTLGNEKNIILAPLGCTDTVENLEAGLPAAFGEWINARNVHQIALADAVKASESAMKKQVEDAKKQKANQPKPSVVVPKTSSKTDKKEPPQGSPDDQGEDAVTTPQTTVVEDQAVPGLFD